MKKISITAFCCNNALYSGLKEADLERAYVDGVQIIETPCSGKVDAIYMLKAFEKETDCVVVLACDQRQCATATGSRRAEKRVEHTKRLLEEAGWEPGRVMYLTAKRPALKNLEEIFDYVRKEYKRLGLKPV